MSIIYILLISLIIVITQSALSTAKWCEEIRNKDPSKITPTDCNALKYAYSTFDKLKDATDDDLRKALGKGVDQDKLKFVKDEIKLKREQESRLRKPRKHRKKLKKRAVVCPVTYIICNSHQDVIFHIDTVSRHFWYRSRSEI